MINWFINWWFGDRLYCIVIFYNIMYIVIIFEFLVDEVLVSFM